MQIEEVRGISPSYVQCWDCRNTKILDKEPTLGVVSEEIKTRFNAVVLNHAHVHPSHRVTITYYTQELPVEQVTTELPIMRDMQRLLDSVRPK